MKTLSILLVVLALSFIIIGCSKTVDDSSTVNNAAVANNSSTVAQPAINASQTDDVSSADLNQTVDNIFQDSGDVDIGNMT